MFRPQALSVSDQNTRAGNRTLPAFPQHRQTMRAKGCPLVGGECGPKCCRTKRNNAFTTGTTTHVPKSAVAGSPGSPAEANEHVNLPAGPMLHLSSAQAHQFERSEHCCRTITPTLVLSSSAPALVGFSILGPNYFLNPPLKYNML